VALTARGPLRLHPGNRRYFADGSGRAIYLTGSHTWASLVDRGPSDPPPAFDFGRYLDFMVENGQNLIRLWTRHSTWYHDYHDGVLWAAPLPWERTGPGQALDGKPRFDLTRPSQAYFDRLRQRAVAAGQRGIYVSVMLFGGRYECAGGWRGNPFHGRNNVNGLDGDVEGDIDGRDLHRVTSGPIWDVQRAYVARVVDTLNDLDNVLYEISNEGYASSAEWQRRLVDVIRGREATMPKQHPIGMTCLWSSRPNESNHALAASLTEWISPDTTDRIGWPAGPNDPPPAMATKVSILDSDHWFVNELYGDAHLGRSWVWKAFCRGYNTWLMEHLPPVSVVGLALTVEDPGYVASRTAMRHTRRYAERMELAAAAPSPVGYCLANPGVEYLAYRPPGGALHLRVPAGRYDAEWFDPAGGKVLLHQALLVADDAELPASSIDGEVVLYLTRT
jgi:hypothetical protein